MVPVRNYNQNWLPNAFIEFFDNDWMVKANATAPSINVSEDDKKYMVELAVPGMTKEDFEIHVDENNDLVINMEKKVENKEEDKKGKKYLRREFSYTKFQQTLALPDNVVRDQISANVKDGILNVELPKQLEEPKPQHRAIEVK